MKFEYREAEHLYLLDGDPIPSLTGMLGEDGCNAHLANALPSVVEAKAKWGTRLHLALQKVEYGYGVDSDFKQHCVDWLVVCERMKWGVKGEHLPIWKVCELPRLAEVSGFVFGFTVDRAAPQAVVELKGTYSPHYGHGIQTALQVIGMQYHRETPRYVCYFDKAGLKKLVTCRPTIVRDGQKLDVWSECDRIIFEHAKVLEAA
jgi:hypothetical protein